MSKVDDWGLFDARPSILRACLYPLRVDRIKEGDIIRWMDACKKANLIVLYELEGKPYLQMLDTNWQKRSDAKYPLPTDNNCKQLLERQDMSRSDPTTTTYTNTYVLKGGAGGKHFDEFWKIYPKKVGKTEARKAWLRHKADSFLEQIKETLAWQVKLDQWLERRFIPNPATWINQERWTDEAPPAPAPMKSLDELYKEMKNAGQ